MFWSAGLPFLLTGNTWFSPWNTWLHSSIYSWDSHAESWSMRWQVRIFLLCAMSGKGAAAYTGSGVLNSFRNSGIFMRKGSSMSRRHKNFCRNTPTCHFQVLHSATMAQNGHSSLRVLALQGRIEWLAFNFSWSEIGHQTFFTIWHRLWFKQRQLAPSFKCDLPGEDRCLKLLLPFLLTRSKVLHHRINNFSTWILAPQTTNEPPEKVLGFQIWRQKSAIHRVARWHQQ